MFEVSNLTKKFRTDFWKREFYGLQNVSFKIKSGENVGFLGANGAGKTTFLKILLGFISANDGTILFNEGMGVGKNVFKEIGYMPERPYYYPHLTGREFLYLCGELQEMKIIDIKKQIEKWSKIFKIDHALDRLVKSYSKGMLQRLGFSSALLHDPKLIILDEPLSGLDPIGRKDFKDVLRDLHSKGKTVFFSSHIVADVEEVCEKVVVLEEGKQVYSGSIDELLAKNVSHNYIIKVATNDQLKEVFKENFSYELAGFEYYKVSISIKTTFVSYCVENKIDIETIEQERLTLEDVIYKIRG